MTMSKYPIYALCSRLMPDTPTITDQGCYSTHEQHNTHGHVSYKCDWVFSILTLLHRIKMLTAHTRNIN